MLLSQTVIQQLAECPDCECHSHELSSERSAEIQDWVLDLQVFLPRELISKIKCDESQPYCRKCTDTGRKCEGPKTHQIRFAEDQCSSPKYQVLLPEVSLHTPQHSDDERWAFNYFVHRAAPVFAGIIDVPFWLELVPRLAQSYTFVWHMAVTISWAFEHVQYRELKTVFDTGRPTAVVINADHRRALKWYNKALVSFRHLLERGEADNAHILLSCILFGSFEFQQRNVGNALRLMDNAYKMLAQNLSTSPAQQMPTINIDIHEMVTAFSSRKAILMATLATPTLPEWTYQTGERTLGPLVIATLSILDEFRKYLYKLMYEAYEVVRVTALLSHDEYEMQKLRPRQQTCLRDLQRWKDSFLRLQDDLRNGETEWISSYFWMHWGVSHVWLSSCLSPLETSFDEYMDEFAAIVGRAEDVIDHSAGDKIIGPIFSCEIEVVPSLYFAATKCRHPILRSQALRLLRKVPYRKSIWASIASPRVVEKMIAIEEGHDQFVEYCVPTEFLALAPEECRIHHVAIIRGNVIEGRRRLKFQWSKVAFDSHGSMRMVHENVWLEDCIDETSRDSALSIMV